jgi:hypothetical protein
MVFNLLLVHLPNSHGISQMNIVVYSSKIQIISVIFLTILNSAQNLERRMCAQLFVQISYLLQLLNPLVIWELILLSEVLKDSVYQWVMVVLIQDTLHVKMN